MNKTKVLGLIRHALTALGGSGLTAAWATGDEVTAIVSGIVTLIGVVWSYLAPEKAKV